MEVPKEAYSNIIIYLRNWLRLKMCNICMLTLFLWACRELKLTHFLPTEALEQQESCRFQTPAGIQEWSLQGECTDSNVPMHNESCKEILCPRIRINRLLSPAAVFRQLCSLFCNITFLKTTQQCSTFACLYAGRFYWGGKGSVGIISYSIPFS